MTSIYNCSKTKFGSKHQNEHRLYVIALFIWYKRIREPLLMSDLNRSDDYNNKSMSFHNYVTKTDSRINKLTAIQS